jgi:hypothetical protein
VELSLPFLREALALGLPLTAVSKWYHRRAIHALRTLPSRGRVLLCLPVFLKLPGGGRRYGRDTAASTNP